MAGPAYFIAALAICFSMAAAVASASNTPGHNPCSFAELPIQYCKSFLQKGIHCSKPSLACCALVSDIFMVNPSCLCEVMKPSFLGVAADPARVSLLPELCHLPTKNLHCFAPPPSSSPITHPPPATPPSISISSPPSISISSPPSNPPSGSVEAPSSNAPPASVEAPSSSPPSGPVVEPPANAPSSSISVPPSHPPSSSIAAPPTSATAPASAPGSNSHPPATAPAAAPSSSDALKLASSLVGVLANLAFATALFCSI